MNDNNNQKKINSTPNKELTENELSEIMVKDDFEDFYIPPPDYKMNLLEKEEILKKYKKKENLLEFNEN